MIVPFLPGLFAPAPLIKDYTSKHYSIGAKIVAMGLATSISRDPFKVSNFSPWANGRLVGECRKAKHLYYLSVEIMSDVRQVFTTGNVTIRGQYSISVRFGCDDCCFTNRLIRCLSTFSQLNRNQLVNRTVRATSNEISGHVLWSLYNMADILTSEKKMSKCYRSGSLSWT